MHSTDNPYLDAKQLLMTEIAKRPSPPVKAPQSEKPPRITFRHFIAEIFAVLNFEKGIFFTLRELLIRPKQYIEDYLYHDRRKKAHPLRFLFLSAALATFLSLNFFLTSDHWVLRPTINDDGSVNIGPALRGFEEDQQEDALALIEDPEKREVIDNLLTELSTSFKRSLNGLFLLIVPIQAFFTWLFFRKRRYNFAEHLVANAFICGLLNVLFIVFTPLLIFVPQTAIAVVPLLILLSTYVIAAAFKSKGWAMGIIASSTVLFLSGLIYVVAAIALVIVQVPELPS